MIQIILWWIFLIFWLIIFGLLLGHLFLGVLSWVAIHLRETQHPDFRPWQIKEYDHFKPEVSIICCAKNEEDSIGNLLEGLVKQDYPPEKFEILIVDDLSDDNTPNIVLDYIKKYKETGPKIHLLQKKNYSPKPEGFNPVAHGITLAIEESSHEIIIITEADCMHYPTYLKFVVYPFSDEYNTLHKSKYNPNRIEFVASPPIMIGNSLIETLQRIDYSIMVWHQLGALELGRAWLKKEVGAWGGSLAFTKSLFKRIEGWKGIEHHSVQDLAIVRKLQHGTNIRALLAFDRRVQVESETEPTLKRAIRQRMRWFKGCWDLKGDFPDFKQGQFILSGIPFILENFSIAMIILSLLEIILNLNFIPESIFFFPNWILALIVLSLVYLIRYGTVIQAQKSEVLTKGYKIRKTAWLLLGFWLWFYNWMYIMSYFKRSIVWK
ncbi:MAG: glycosyltransferase [Candidatus Lokiarchaeota archaeon]|nr:glycosyltransferase [Candidatus Lokiarchaeota archaeon]